MAKCCSHGTLLHFSLQCSHLNTCYYHQDLHMPQLYPTSRCRFRCHGNRPSTRQVLYRSRAIDIDGRAWIYVSSAIHFQDQSIRQVSCYTLLSGFLLLRPPSCCQYRLTPFMVSNEKHFWHLSSTFGSSHIASSAYQKWPTWCHCILPSALDYEVHRLAAHLKFENRSRTICPQCL